MTTVYVCAGCDCELVRVGAGEPLERRELVCRDCFGNRAAVERVFGAYIVPDGPPDMG